MVGVCIVKRHCVQRMDVLSLINLPVRDMLNREHSICFLGAGFDACALWRLYFPHLNMQGSSFFLFAGKPDFNVIAGCDFVVVQRCCTQSQFEFIQVCQKLDMKIVYEIDDNLWNLPKENPAEQIFTSWRQGFNICIRMVDVVSVSTKELAKVVKSNVKNMVNLKTGKHIPIVVTENKMDTRLFAPPLRQEKLTVGWAGSSSHIGDLGLVTDAIINIASEKEHSEVMFEFRGCDPPSILQRLPTFRHRLWSNVAEFSSRMPSWGWTIGLAPLTDHEFNNSKSGIKLYESAWCKVPCLASWVKPYDDFCSHDPELRWLLCAGKSNWEPKMRELIHDPARASFLGNRMYDVLLEHYTWNKPHSGWQNLIETVRNV
jgi:hypothetical protein